MAVIQRETAIGNALALVVDLKFATLEWLAIYLNRSLENPLILSLSKDHRAPATSP